MGFIERNNVRLFIFTGVLVLALLVSGQVTSVGSDENSLTWFRERADVTQNNLKQTWKLGRVPPEEALVLVSRNGLLLSEDLDYIHFSGTVTFLEGQSVLAGDVLQFIYQAR